MPALREHPEDIPAIATAILRRRAAEIGRDPPCLRAEDLARLRAFDWPGNVRQLDNVLRRLLAYHELPELVAEPPGDWRAQLDQAIHRHGGNKSVAARRLGISRTSLYKALARRGSSDDPVNTA
jgi:DNA-binding NtrC family response regulator